MKMQVFECLRCEKEWAREPVRGQRPKFCPECRAESRGNGWRQVECLSCHRPFWVGVSAHPRRYCTPECRPAPVGYIPVPWVAHPSCEHCQRPFLSKWPSKYCREECKSAAKKDFEVSPARRRRLYERDGWVCLICHLPVARRERLTDAAPSLDHIIPRAHGGTDEDTNLRTAHRLCNSYRADGALTDEEVAALTQERLALSAA